MAPCLTRRMFASLAANYQYYCHYYYYYYYYYFIIIIIFIISSFRAFRRARDSEAKGRVDWKRSRWPDAKFEVAGAKCALRNDRSPAQSFARSLTHSLAREKRDERGSRPRKTTTTRRREKREERREKREERRQKTDPKRPPEVPK